MIACRQATGSRNFLPAMRPTHTACSTRSVSFFSVEESS